MIQAEGKCLDMQSIIVPACLVCGFVASLAFMLLVHQYECEPNNVNRQFLNHTLRAQGESGFLNAKSESAN